jgi:hypothetical protein
MVTIVPKPIKSEDDCRTEFALDMRTHCHQPYRFPPSINKHYHRNNVTNEQKNDSVVIGNLSHDAIPNDQQYCNNNNNRKEISLKPYFCVKPPKITHHDRNNKSKHISDNNHRSSLRPDIDQLY